MSAPTPRGWCPSLFEPMETGDGLLVRVKPRGGVLPAAAAALLADAAAAHGNGAIELTGRASLQCRGFTPESAARFADAIVRAGLASPDPAAERRRVVLATPLAGVDPTSNPATAAVTAALEDALEQHALPADLPAKFGFLVDGGGILGLANADADIRLLLDTACALSIAGGRLAARVSIEDAVPAALRLARAFLMLAGGGERRMRGLVGVIGEAAVFAEAGLTPEPAARPHAPARPPIGPIAPGVFGVGAPFGSLSADLLASLAAIARRFGDGALRLTPWRAVLLAGVAPVDAASLAAALTALDLIVDPEDGRLRVSACPGRPACASATVVTRELAASLRPPRGESVHVSGCSKGCARPGPATITLVGRDGRFDLVRNGRAGDAPARLGLAPSKVLAL